MNKFWQVKNEGESDVEILLYGQIASDKSWFSDDVNPKQFAQDLNNLSGKNLTVRINSSGGDVFAAHAIHNLLLSYKGFVTVVVDGLCASAATIVAMAGGKIVMPTNALFMIHNPAIGLNNYYTKNELVPMIDALATIKDSIVAAYKKRCKATEQELIEMMDNETWLSASECIEKGFADEVVGNVEPVLAGNNLFYNAIKFDLTKFKNYQNLQMKILTNKEGKNKMTKLEEILNKFGFMSEVDNNAEKKEKNAQQQVADAINQERQRIANLDKLNADNNPYIAAVVNTAKQEGKTAEDIASVVDAVKKVNPLSNTFFNNLLKDNKDSGADGVKTANQVPAAQQQEEQDISGIVNAMNKVWGGKK